METDLDILGIGFSPHFADTTTDGMIPANGTLFHVSGVHKVSDMVGSRRDLIRPCYGEVIVPPKETPFKIW